MQFTKQENDSLLFEFNLKPNLTTNATYSLLLTIGKNIIAFNINIYRFSWACGKDKFFKLHENLSLHRHLVFQNFKGL
jgi:hypothetical protein